MASLFRGQDEIAQKIAERVTAAANPPTSVEGPFNYVYGENVRPGPVRPPDKDQTQPGAIPHRCVFVQPVIAPPTTAYIGGRALNSEPSDWRGNYPDSFQVLCRARPDEEDMAFNMADAAYRGIDKTTTAGYFAITAETRPQRLMRDAQGAAEYVFNVTAIRCQ